MQRTHAENRRHLVFPARAPLRRCLLEKKKHANFCKFQKRFLFYIAVNLKMSVMFNKAGDKRRHEDVLRHDEEVIGSLCRYLTRYEAL